MDVLFCPEASRREGRELPGASSPEEGDHCWTGWRKYGRIVSTDKRSENAIGLPVEPTPPK
jgi:hypothetical protein